MRPNIVILLFEEWLCSAWEQYHFARVTHTPVLCCSSCWKKELQLCKCVARRCTFSTLSLLLIPNLTFDFTSHPSQKLNFIKYLCCILLLLFMFHHNFTLSFNTLDYEANVQRPGVFLFFFWSSADYPARPSIIFARFSRQFTCRRSSGMLQLLHSRRERSLFFSFSEMDNIPSAGERAHQEASVKGRER